MEHVQAVQDHDEHMEHVQAVQVHTEPLEHVKANLVHAKDVYREHIEHGQTIQMCIRWSMLYGHKKHLQVI
jgi:hypothetical protein